MSGHTTVVRDGQEKVELLEMSLSKLPLSTGCPCNQSPCLMFFQKRGMCKLFNPVLNDFFSMEIPEIVGARVRFSRYGWLLLCREDRSIFFFNPFTKVKVDLPGIPFIAGFNSLCFTAPPTSSDCVVLGLSGWPTIYVGVVRLGEPRWFTKRLDTRFTVSDCSPVLIKGQYYILGANGNIGIYNPSDKSWVIVGQPLEHFDSLIQSFLAELNGELLAVFVFGMEREVSLCRFDLMKMVWSPIETLGDKVLYVSRGSSYGETAIIKAMANNIYFPKFFGNNGVFYSMNTRLYHSIDDGFSSKMAYNLKYVPLSTWIQPCLDKNM